MAIPYKVPESFNYIAAFLTLRCKFGCGYCINRFGDVASREELSTQGWVDGLTRLITRPDLPVTLQGGEPTMHPGCWSIANALYNKGIPVDILTNGDFDIAEFEHTVPPEVFKREAKYASIRFSFHPAVHDAHALATKVFLLKEMGYNVGIWGVEHPESVNANVLMRVICRTYGIDFRTKEFLGWYKGKWYGEMKYPNACRDTGKQKQVLCRTSELLISPSGHIHKCHSDLYAGINPVGHILDKEIKGVGKWERCKRYGLCNPCDIKVKTNRFQEYGHTSVDIKGRLR